MVDVKASVFQRERQREKIRGKVREGERVGSQRVESNPNSTVIYDMFKTFHDCSMNSL